MKLTIAGGNSKFKIKMKDFAKKYAELSSQYNYLGIDECLKHLISEAYSNTTGSSDVFEYSCSDWGIYKAFRKFSPVVFRKIDKEKFLDDEYYFERFMRPAFETYFSQTSGQVDRTKSILKFLKVIDGNKTITFNINMY